MDRIGEGIGARFQEETKYTREFARSEAAGGPETGRILEKVLLDLPEPDLTGGPTLWQTLQERRSIREYARLPLPLRDLSRLLWATQGVTANAEWPRFRTAPSAGALHPIDTYLVVNRVEAIRPGLYLFHPGKNLLEGIRQGDYSGPLAEAVLGQEMAAEAAVVFIWVAVIHRSSQKYRQRAYRYVYLDCGHIGQNLYLAAAALNLGCCGIAAFYDDEVNRLIGVDGRKETVVYLAAVGKKQ